MMTRRRLLGFGLALIALAGLGVWWDFSAALRVERERVSHGSQVVPSRFGQIEYSTLGQGAPVLVSHGAGGGFDQVMLGVDRLRGAGYRVVAPSRFGYLRSASPPDPSPENQADAYAVLLDDLHIDKAAVVGISAGTLSALQFAARHPERCRALVLIVPAVTLGGNGLPPHGPLAAKDPVSRAIIDYTLRSDFIYWLSITLARDPMIRAILATDPALVEAAKPAERRRVLDVLWHVLPLSERAQGLLDDGRNVTAPFTLALDRVMVPTLVVSLQDDYYGTIVPARIIAAKIPGARLLTYKSGGHLWVGHDAEMFAAVDAFLRQN